MVVWVYADGGETEASGLIPFLQRYLRGDFIRRTPRALPGPYPGKKRFAGSTGPDLRREIRHDIKQYWDSSAEVVLVVDDSDATDPESSLGTLKNAVVEALTERDIGMTDGQFPVVVAIAVPEVESWLLADWEHTFKPAYPRCHKAVQHELSTNRGVRFAAPEAFAVHDEAGQYRKLSEVISEVIRLKCVGSMPYSKAVDTPRLLLRADPDIISGKCPYFRRFWEEIQKYCPAA